MQSEIARTWTANGSCQLVIPKGLANKKGLFNSNVIIEDTADGLLLRKLVVDGGA
jgi:hypothetical protein